MLAIGSRIKAEWDWRARDARKPFLEATFPRLPKAVISPWLSKRSEFRQSKFDLSAMFFRNRESGLPCCDKPDARQGASLCPEDDAVGIFIVDTF
jgi:hypothetical protein